MTKLTRNRAKCRSCGDILESEHRHDFVSCSCSIRARRQVKKFEELLDSYIESNHIAPMPANDRHILQCIFMAAVGTGISIDGGLSEYAPRVIGHLEDYEDLCEYEELENGEIN